MPTLNHSFFYSRQGWCLGGSPHCYTAAMLSPTVRGRVRTAQLLSATLMAGVVTITVAMAVAVQQGGGPAGTAAATHGGAGAAPGGGPGGPTAGSSMTDPLLIMLAVLSVMLLAMAYVIMPLIRMKVAQFAFRRAPAEVDDVERLAGPWMNYVLITSALAEAVGLLGAVVYFLTAESVALAAPAAAVVAMLLAFPTEGRFLSFVRRATGRDVQM